MRPIKKFAVYAAAFLLVALGCLFWVGGHKQTCQVDELIYAPPDVVYEHLTQPDKVKNWAEGVVSIEPLTNDGHRVGAQAKIVIEVDGKRLEFTDEVLVADEDSHLIVVSKASMFQNSADYSLESPDQKTTKIRLINQVQFKGIYRFIGPFAGSPESKLKADIQRLKLAAEKYYEENPTLAVQKHREKTGDPSNGTQPDENPSPDSRK